MICVVGDIVLFESAVAGKRKYHLCFCCDSENDLYKFIFLNSKGGFRDQFEIDAARIPEMPANETGRTVFDCPTIHHKTTAKLAALKPKVICKVPADVAVDFYAFAKTISSMTEHDKALLLAMLEALCK